MRMKRMRTVFTMLAALLLATLLMAAAPSPQQSDDISFSVSPDGKGRARVSVEVSGDYSKVEAKTVQSADWTDITRDMFVTISDDCIVYVQATDKNGSLASKSAYVELPAGTNNATATQSSQTRNSTVAATPSEGGAGTVSQPPSETATAIPEPPPPTATATDVTSETAPATEPVSTPPPAPTTEPPKEVNGVITVGNKQFVTIETRDEEIFYLIIDGDRSEDNVYLVSEVTTQDLLSFAKDDGDDQPAPDADPASLINGGVLPTPTEPPALMPAEEETIAASEEASEPVTEGATEETEPPEGDAEKANPIPGWIVIVILSLITAFAGYMFLIVLPRKKAKEAYVDTADEDDLNEDYEEAPEESEVIPPEVQADLDEDGEDENPLDIPVDDDGEA